MGLDRLLADVDKPLVRAAKDVARGSTIRVFLEYGVREVVGYLLAREGADDYAGFPLLLAGGKGREGLPAEGDGGGCLACVTHNSPFSQVICLDGPALEHAHHAAVLVLDDVAVENRLAAEIAQGHR